MDDNTYQFGNEYMSSFYRSAINGNQDGRYDVSDEYFNDLYLNPLKAFYDDPIFESGIASSSKKILVAGDTITHPGCPPDYNYKWGNLISKELGHEFHSVALMGSSVVSQVRRIFAYIDTYGNPEYIFALFSSFNRMEIPKNNSYYNYGRDVSNKEKIPTYIHPSCIVGGYNEDMMDFPYDPEFIFSEELPQFYSGIFIQMLETYCRQNSIKLVWSTWSSNQEAVLEKARSIAPDKYKNFISLNNLSWNPDHKNKTCIYSGDETCHEDLIDHEQFHFAFDEMNTEVNQTMWGIHRHIHVKEKFMEALSNG
jgi:hypothetical protein